MAQVKVLIAGYAREEAGVESASSTTTLIRYNGLNIIVDPGMNRLLLLKSLAAEDLQLQDINYVILTHTHIDHCYLAGIFDQAKVLDNEAIFSDDGQIVPHNGKVPGTNIEIINTPGHDQFHCSVLADTAELGKVAIAGDLFWWEDGEIQETAVEALINHPDPYMKNEVQLAESRLKILGLANYIIPGHGSIFKVVK